LFCGVEGLEARYKYKWEDIHWRQAEGFVFPLEMKVALIAVLLLVAQWGE
jgi:hypothetical protein